MAFDSKGTLNKVMLIGRLGQDPELKYTQKGAAVLSMSIATNTSVKTQDGDKQDLTEWHRVVMWRKLAEMIAQYAKKGHRIYVEGRLATRSWEDKDGMKRYTTEVVADHCQLLESKDSGSAPPTPEEPHRTADFAAPLKDEEDDLPF